MPLTKPYNREDKFWSKTIRIGKCLIWLGGLAPEGYGRVCVDGKRMLAHVYAWELIHGKIPKGKKVCHKCDNHLCVDAEKHLWLGTQKQNVQDMIQKGRFVSLPGILNGNSRLTENDVRYIRASTRNHSELARVLPVSSVSVSNIRNNKTWRHVVCPY